MTFLQHASKSVNQLRVLIQVDIGTINHQWVNAGAGIWYCNFDASYPEVDASLLVGFTAQIFGDINSMTVDNIAYTKVATLLDVTANATSFYYNGTDEVYIHLVGGDDPIMHDIFFGVVFGLSYNEFTPIGAATTYEGRLSGNLSISQSRDPLYFGKMQFSGFNIQLINADGYFDGVGDSLAFYGNPCRVLVGYPNMDIADYVIISESTVERVTINEDYFKITTTDTRKTLANKINYTCSNINALDAIVAILGSAYGITYDSEFYNTTEWDAATLLVDNVTITSQTTTSTVEAISLIESICKSVFGIFIVQPDGRYSFKVIETASTALTTITKYDILNDSFSLEYNPNEVISSIRVGYSSNKLSTTNESVTWLTDISHVSEVYTKYKIYIQKDFQTVLHDQTGAQALADTIMAYSKDVHGRFSITVPLKYYEYDIGDLVNVEITRETTTMLGTKKCEIIGKSYDLSDGTITFEMRIV